MPANRQEAEVSITAIYDARTVPAQRCRQARGRASMCPMKLISRRAFNLAAAALMAAPRLAWPDSGKAPMSLDHVILGCHDLDAGIEYVFQRTGVRAAPGGVHPGAGTKNALLSLGTLRYLEIIAPDPLQPASADPRHVASLMDPKPGSRARPDGSTLNWTSLTLKDDKDGVLPFFIEWGSTSLHPSVDAPTGCRLTDLWISAPNPGDLRTLAAKLQLEVQIRQSDETRLAATI